MVEKKERRNAKILGKYDLYGVGDNGGTQNMGG